MPRAPRIWHIEERFGYAYSTNQFGGFTRHDTRDAAASAIEKDIAEYGDRWRDQQNTPRVQTA